MPASQGGDRIIEFQQQPNRARPDEAPYQDTPAAAQPASSKTVTILHHEQPPPPELHGRGGGHRSESPRSSEHPGKVPPRADPQDFFPAAGNMNGCRGGKEVGEEGTTQTDELRAWRSGRSSGRGRG